MKKRNWRVAVPITEISGISVGLRGSNRARVLSRLKLSMKRKIEEFPPFVSKKEAELFKSDYYD